MACEINPVSIVIGLKSSLSLPSARMFSDTPSVIKRISPGERRSIAYFGTRDRRHPAHSGFMSKRAKNFLETNTPKKPRKSLETISESQDPSCKGVFGLLGLSTDILATIVSFLSGLNICRVTCVCKHWCILFSHHLVWRPLCNDLILMYKPLANNNYRQVYREFYSATQMNLLIKLTANHARSHKVSF